jgi:uncharacterized protein (TIGR02265 family)
MADSEKRLIPHSLVKDLIVGNQFSANPLYLQILKDQFGYDHNNPNIPVSVENYVLIIDYVRNLAFPQKSQDEGYFLVGTASLEGHFQGVVGKINKIAARMFNIEKSADLYLKTQNSNYPFGSHQIEEVRAGYFRYRRTNVPVPPAFTSGVITSLLELTGGKNVKVAGQMVGNEDTIYQATWD